MNTTVEGAVVVGVDGSQHSDLALDWAVRHAEAEHRPLVILHAAGVPPARPVGNAVESRHELRIHGRRVTDAALAYVQRHDVNVEVRVMMRMEHARTALLQAGEEAAVVVVGSRGRGAVRSLLLGSVSAAVAAGSRCPVVVVRRAEQPAADRVVVGVDGSITSMAAVGMAFEEASRAGRALAVLHADPLEAWADWAPGPEPESEGRRLVAEALAGYREKYPDVRVATVVLRGDPAPVLVRESAHAALVVVGSRGRGAAKALLLGSTSRYVVEHARCPVLVAR